MQDTDKVFQVTKRRCGTAESQRENIINDRIWLSIFWIVVKTRDCRLFDCCSAFSAGLGGRMKFLGVLHLQKGNVQLMWPPLGSQCAIRTRIYSRERSDPLVNLSP